MSIISHINTTISATTAARDKLVARILAQGGTAPSSDSLRQLIAKVEIMLEVGVVQIASSVFHTTFCLATAMCGIVGVTPVYSVRLKTFNNTV